MLRLHKQSMHYLSACRLPLLRNGEVISLTIDSLEKPKVTSSKIYIFTLSRCWENGKLLLELLAFLQRQDDFNFQHVHRTSFNHMEIGHDCGSKSLFSTPSNPIHTMSHGTNSTSVPSTETNHSYLRPPG